MIEVLRITSSMQKITWDREHKEVLYLKVWSNG